MEARDEKMTVLTKQQTERSDTLVAAGAVVRDLAMNQQGISSSSVVVDLVHEGDERPNNIAEAILSLSAIFSMPSKR